MEKTYEIKPILGDDRDKCLSSVFIKKDVFDKAVSWNNFLKLTQANTNLFNNEYFTKAQSIKDFIGRTIPFKLLDINSEVQFTFKSYMNYIRFLGQQIIHECTNELHIPDNTELTRWKQGTDMNVHSDNSWPDGNKTDHPTSFRTWSAIYYLNDDYEGGEIYFPRIDWAYKPEANSLLVFPSNDSYLHGVTEVSKGERFTVAIWYTQDYTHIEV